MIGSDDRRYQVFVSSTFDDLQEERQHSMIARHRVMQLIISQIAGRFSDAQEWLALVSKSGRGIAPEDLTGLVVAIQRQFLGLDLVDVMTIEGAAQFPHSGSAWHLTQRGRLQLLAVSGLRRNQG
jgi:hypothetical protein